MARTNSWMVASSTCGMLNEEESYYCTLLAGHKGEHRSNPGGGFPDWCPPWTAEPEFATPEEVV